eukprot:903454-Amphidinium_carterae.1
MSELEAAILSAWIAPSERMSTLASAQSWLFVALLLVINLGNVQFELSQWQSPEQGHTSSPPAGSNISASDVHTNHGTTNSECRSTKSTRVHPHLLSAVAAPLTAMVLKRLTRGGLHARAQ